MALYLSTTNAMSMIRTIVFSMCRVRRWKRVVVSVFTVLLLAIISSHLIAKKKKPITVYVIEEHHEALPYWIESANTGEILKSGNTLVHIDGHADNALPQVFSGMAFFQWPRTDSEVDLMLQQNDVFIQEAVSIGLIDRFLWIFPEWTNETRDIEWKVEDLGLGWTKVIEPGETGPELVTEFCLCEYNQTENPDKTKGQKIATCYYNNFTFEPPEDPNVLLEKPELCRVQKHYTMEYMPMKVALKRLRDKELFTEHESVILDIDEDYFGCEIPGRKLYDVDLNWATFADINGNLSLVFCPLFIHHEAQGSALMSSFLHKLIDLCANSQQSPFRSKCQASVQSILFRTYPEFVDSWKKDPELFCAHTNQELKDSLTKVIKFFISFQPKQLKAMLNLGFCFNTSPKTIWFDSEGHLILCHGTNDPENPMVEEYVPKDESELRNSLAFVEEFLHESLDPRVVTLCRSVRDGYTPRSITSRVEKTLLNFFESQVELETSDSKHSSEQSVKNEQSHRKYRILYDHFLFNGINGV